MELIYERKSGAYNQVMAAQNIYRVSKWKVDGETNVTIDSATVSIELKNIREDLADYLVEKVGDLLHYSGCQDLNEIINAYKENNRKFNEVEELVIHDVFNFNFNEGIMKIYPNSDTVYDNKSFQQEIADQLDISVLKKAYEKKCNENS